MVTRRVSLATWTFEVVLVWYEDVLIVVVVASNLIELSGMPPPKAHDQEPKLRTRIRTSCQEVPVAFVARRSRIPSVSPPMRPPFIRPSMVGVGSDAGANAAVPVTELRTVEGEP